MSLEIGDDNIMGALDIGDLEYVNSLADVGARRRRRGRAMAPRVPYRRFVSPTPGVPNRGAGLAPLGLPNIAFTATSGAALQQQTQPQRPFVPKRLIITVTRVGATSTGAVTVTRLDIGADSQLVGANAVPVEMFAAGAFDLNLQFKPAQLGSLVVVGAALGTPALTMTDTVTLTIGFMGETIF